MRALNDLTADEPRGPKHYPTVVYVNEHGDRIAHRRRGRRHEIRTATSVAEVDTIAEADEAVADIQADIGGTWRVEPE